MRALIFDLDRTLVDTVSTHVIGWERAFNELGLTIRSLANSSPNRRVSRFIYADTRAGIGTAAHTSGSGVARVPSG